MASGFTASGFTASGFTASGFTASGFTASGFFIGVEVGVNILFSKRKDENIWL
jgi:hypothetical protein